MGHTPEQKWYVGLPYFYATFHPLSIFSGHLVPEIAERRTLCPVQMDAYKQEERVICAFNSLSRWSNKNSPSYQCPSEFLVNAIGNVLLHNQNRFILNMITNCVPFENQKVTATVHRDHPLQVGLNIIYRDISWCKIEILWGIVILIFLYPWQHYFQSNESKGSKPWMTLQLYTDKQQQSPQMSWSNSSPPLRMIASVCTLSKRSLEPFPARSVHLYYNLTD